jgi:hypothetical protein
MFRSAMRMRLSSSALYRIRCWLEYRLGMATVFPFRSGIVRMPESLWTIIAVPSRCPR